MSLKCNYTRVIHDQIKILIHKQKQFTCRVNEKHIKLLMTDASLAGHYTLPDRVPYLAFEYGTLKTNQQHSAPCVSLSFPVYVYFDFITLQCDM